jgi:hypothetical protein
MRHYLIAAMVAAAMGAGPARAQDTSTLTFEDTTTLTPEQFRGAVKWCVYEVQAPYKERQLHSSFDAYYDDSTQKVRYFGTDEDRFEFEKCLFQTGHPVK